MGQVEKAEVAWEDFLWSCLVFRSRRFTSRKLNSEALLPIIDLINAGTEDSVAKHGSNFDMHIAPGKALRAGEELLHSYERSYKKSNEFFVREYGFLILGNPTPPSLLSDEQQSTLLDSLQRIDEDSVDGPCKRLIARQPFIC